MKNSDVTKEQVLKELYMLTGKVTQDATYLYYLLVKDGTYFKKKPEVVEDISTPQTVDSFEDWFNKL